MTYKDEIVDCLAHSSPIEPVKRGVHSCGEGNDYGQKSKVGDSEVDDVTVGS